MNIQKLKDLINHRLVVVFLLITGCNNSSEELRVIEIYSGIELNENSNYSEPIINIRGLNYSIKQRTFYNNFGVLTKVILYKSEGNIEYFKIELEKDSSLLKYLNVPLKQNWIIKGDRLQNDSTSTVVKKVEGNLFKMRVGNSTVFIRAK